MNSLTAYQLFADAVVYNSHITVVLHVITDALMSLFLLQYVIILILKKPFVSNIIVYRPAVNF